MYDIAYPKRDMYDEIRITLDFNLVRGVPVPSRCIVRTERIPGQREKPIQYGDVILGLRTLLVANQRSCVDIMSKTNSSQKYGEIVLYPPRNTETANKLQFLPLEWPVAGDFLGSSHKTGTGRRKIYYARSIGVCPRMRRQNGQQLLLTMNWGGLDIPLTGGMSF